MTNLDISANRKAIKYSSKELLLRVFWGFGRLLFRFSPRPCFGVRRMLLRCAGAKVGRNVNIYPSAIIYFPWNLEIGDDSAIGEWALIYNLGRVTIGARATISHRAHLCAGTHDYEQINLPLLKTPINVGDEVWICSDAFVGPGVVIEKRAVVGARSVVFKDVAESCVVAGNVAQFLKKRKLP